MRKTASDGDVDVPAAKKPQLNSHISPRTPRIRLPYAG